MRILITGICGFVGSVLARSLPTHIERLEVLGLDNLSRPGSEQNRWALKGSKTPVFHADVRCPSDLEAIPKVDWVIDAAANPSVLAGLADTSSRQLMEHNLVGTLNLLELCKRNGSGMILLSTSRVYSVARLRALELREQNSTLLPEFNQLKEPGLSAEGIGEGFSTQPPLSLYGSAKLASELLSLEYGSGFGLPVHVNRCGVLAGAGQFGKADQGIFSYWIHSYRARRPLKYIGFGGTGCQVRDCLHPRDLASLVAMQMRHPEKGGKVLNVSGGMASSISLAQLSQWCARRFGEHHVGSDRQERPFDVPWLVLNATKAQQQWNWRPTVSLEEILKEIAEHAEANPRWLDISGAV
ncbi:MAG TPA: NAD-dependent epimerase/dehydratase family protein [Patescibacteria group bacterium]|nr:NAD-dependent epimerase/dehydratase family protein [Patescibacteria group bacterium]